MIGSNAEEAAGRSEGPFRAARLADSRATSTGNEADRARDFSTTFADLKSELPGTMHPWLLVSCDLDILVHSSGSTCLLSALLLSHQSGFLRLLTSGVFQSWRPSLLSSLHPSLTHGRARSHTPSTNHDIAIESRRRVTPMSVPVRETGLSPEQAQCIQAIRRLIPTKFILVGGAAIIWRGHVRTTSDVDILVSDANILNQLKSADGFGW